MNDGDSMAVRAAGTMGTGDQLSKGSLRWYWNRVSAMESAELPYRMLSAMGSMAEQTRTRLGWNPAVPRPRLRSATPDPWMAGAASLPPVDAAAYLEEADTIVAGLVERLDGRFCNIGSPVDWGHAAAIDARPEQEDDIRHAMQLHRHGHLPRLAQAWRLSENPKYLDTLIDHVDTWLTQCPPSRGMAWASALDVALRLLNWSIVWQLLDGHRSDRIPAPLRARWTDSIYAHARFIRQNLSRYSSANNHLAGELLGLAVVRATWPLWPEVVAWGEKASRELSMEALRQTFPDGVNREQASWYHSFLFEVLAVHVQIERAHGRDVDDGVIRRMRAMAHFVAALRDCCGHLSHHGDADHASSLSLSPGLEDPYLRVISLAVGLRIAPHLAPLDDHHSPVCAWLIGGRRRTRPRSLAQPDHRLVTRRKLPRAFPDGGYYLLGERFGEFDEVLVIVDAGPIGYLGIAAHGHADALSLRLSVRGHPILVDRGTFAYNTAAPWRRYFRGTLAHNTVCVDGVDQSVCGGPFLWLRKARTRVESFESSDVRGHVAAQHDGYRRLSDPLTHARRVEWDAAARRIIVADTLRSRGPHQAAIAWHFDPNCSVSIVEGHRVLVRCDTVTVTMEMAEADRERGRWTLHEGDDRSMLGWHSPHFADLVPAPSVVWTTLCEGTATFTTRIIIDNDQGEADATDSAGL